MKPWLNVLQASSDAYIKKINIINFTAIKNGECKIESMTITQFANENYNGLKKKKKKTTVSGVKKIWCGLIWNINDLKLGF